MKRPEDLVGFSMRRSTKEGIDVFPDYFSVSGDFEKASEGSLIDQRVAVWQALGVAHRHVSIKDVGTGGKGK